MNVWRWPRRSVACCCIPSWEACRRRWDGLAWSSSSRRCCRGCGAPERGTRNEIGPGARPGGCHGPRGRDDGDIPTAPRGAAGSADPPGGRGLRRSRDGRGGDHRGGRAGYPDHDRNAAERVGDGGGLSLPDGLVAVVKRDCPTCRLVAPVLGELAAAVPLTVYSQDDPTFPPGLPVRDDRGLEASYRLRVAIVPTLLQVAAGRE